LIYEWRCLGCATVITVQRPVAEYKFGPIPSEMDHDDSGGEPCYSTNFRRILSVPKRINVPENEDQYWKDDNYRRE
jgi:hypothetical protein